MAFGTIMGQKPLVNAEDVEGVLSPDNIPNIDMSKLTGVLPLLKGGTGVTSIEALKSLLGVGEQVKFYATCYYGQDQYSNSVLESIGFMPNFAIYIGCGFNTKSPTLNIVVVDTKHNTSSQIWLSIVNSAYMDFNMTSPAFNYNSNGLSLSTRSGGRHSPYEVANLKGVQYVAIAIG